MNELPQPSGNAGCFHAGPRQDAAGEPLQSRRMYALVKAAARLALTPFFPLRVQGKHHLPTDSAYVLLPKHQRWQDIPLVGLAVEQPLHFIAKVELFRYRPGDWFFRSLGGIPINRQRPIESRRSLMAAMALLQQGEGIVVFPEGTYYPGVMGTGKPGLVRFVVSRMRLPFVPVGIRYRRLGWRVHTRVAFGRPRYPDAYVDINNFVADLMTDIGRLSGMAPPPDPVAN